MSNIIIYKICLSCWVLYWFLDSIVKALPEPNIASSKTKMIYISIFKGFRGISGIFGFIFLFISIIVW